MIEVEATHIVGVGANERLAIELYPGVFVVDGGGVHAAMVAGHLFEALPAGQERTFPLDGDSAELAAEMYDAAVAMMQSEREFGSTRPAVVPTDKFTETEPMTWEMPPGR